MTPLVVVFPGDLDTPSGGYRYDRAMVRGLRAMGRAVTLVSLDGDYPQVDQAGSAAAIDRLAHLPAGARVVVDGLALGALPALADVAAGRYELIGLVHHPLADETGLSDAWRERFLAQERRVYPACARLIVTSRFTARRLVEGFGVAPTAVHVVEPGTDAAPVAAGCGSPVRLLSVGSLIPRKGHAVLLDALAPLAGLDWRLDIVGSLEADPATADALVAQCRSLRLDDRVRFLGACDSDTLAGHYHQADLFVLASHYEGYGMVFNEALARGLPVVTTTGGAIADTVPADAGLLVPPGDVQALRTALEGLLTDASLRQRYRAGALRARDRLVGWPQAVQAFARAVDDGDGR